MSTELDYKIDHYNTLGLTATASTEELKAAYVNLALKYHPDSASKTGASDQENKDQFIKISEAWSVLSKPELKAQYDTLRKQHMIKFGGEAGALSSSASSKMSEIHQGFLVQRNNFARVQYNASSNWQDLQDKYKSEKWQKMPLKERKASRIRPVVSSKVGIVVVAVPTILGAYVLFNAFS